MDALSLLLDNLRVRKTICTKFEVTAPWGHRVENLSRVKFVLVLSGSCRLKTKRHKEPVRLGPGDLFFAFDGLAYTLSDSSRTRAVDCRDLEKLRDGYVIRYGGEGAATSLISVALDLEEESARTVLSALPSFLRVRVGQRRGATLQALIELMEKEIGEGSLGSGALVQRLVEGLFISALRDYIDNLPAGEKGLFAALAHRQMGAVIQAMCGAPSKDWTLARLSRSAGMSRSAFATKFRKLVGKAPLEFLTAHRMALSMRLLRSELSVAEVAAAVGYDSEIAFARAFKRIHRATPSAYRISLSTAAHAFDSQMAATNDAGKRPAHRSHGAGESILALYENSGRVGELGA